MYPQDKPPLDELAHFGVKGMRWGIRNPKKSLGEYRNEVETKALGAEKTVVFAKNGDKLTVSKQKTPASALVVGKLTGRKPEAFMSQMIISNKAGNEVGRFQVWREGQTGIRGEWLEIKPSEQGKGYSKAALFGLMEAARRDPKLQEVRLQVPSNALPAQHIYGGLGFRKDKDLGLGLEDWVYKVPRGGRS